ncbi:MAG: 16S rRNA (cytosine(1402)-N(4))-methyltransferase RsmH [Nitrospinota bacterium]|nr:MAG: 16S rRNA (cytosine(1402)-N(4))-methyltransferase RsmH [Nitrospinota bacterium]
MASSRPKGETRHLPVLVEQVIAFLSPHPGGLYADCTLGEGGHTRALLQASAPSGRVLGIDRDAAMLRRAQQNLAEFGERVIFCHDSFHHLADILRAQGWEKLDGILMDLGLSSFHLQQPERGFSFQQPGPLDMRFNQEDPLTAAELVNTLSQEELCSLLKTYGEERWAPQIAKAIVQRRLHAPIVRTDQLVACILAAIPGRRSRRIHPATKTFQALRIAVNAELQILQEGLTTALDCLKPGGRICVITFHSLEDRIVKQIFRTAAGRCRCPPHLPSCLCGRQGKIRILTKKPVVPTREEIAQNPRSRSAKLRAAERIMA